MLYFKFSDNLHRPNILHSQSEYLFQFKICGPRALKWSLCALLPLIRFGFIGLMLPHWKSIANFHNVPHNFVQFLSIISLSFLLWYNFDDTFHLVTTFGTSGLFEKDYGFLNSVNLPFSISQL